MSATLNKTMFVFDYHLSYSFTPKKPQKPDLLIAFIPTELEDALGKSVSTHTRPPDKFS